ncbi:toxin-activating lysine-acyltransferase [Acinetobacter sp. Marseille-Q1623]|uniref:toxin-activating lysine-acyltransferase n=1 Tax=Acinetobacter sp. Marseille-Q1623 TaxID=2697501 RepID=UPI00157B7CAD|nr:toxin-activating lysine-acyltransferase [Acinetobacter sp. Marseille-Q1623]
MKFDGIDVISPALFPSEQWNEAEVLGAMTWLWFLSDNCKNLTVSDIALHVLPTIKNRQFAVFSQNSQPFGYISWANLDEQSEARYVSSESWIYTHSNWNCGDRMWLINWFAPLGHSALMKKLIETHLFPDHCFRAFYHKGLVEIPKIMTFKGKSVSKSDVNLWAQQHPILASRSI